MLTNITMTAVLLLVCSGLFIKVFRFGEIPFWLASVAVICFLGSLITCVAASVAMIWV